MAPFYYSKMIDRHINVHCVSRVCVLYNLLRVFQAGPGEK